MIFQDKSGSSAVITAESGKPCKGKTKHMKQITKHFKNYRKELILGPFFKLLEAVLELMVPLIMANIINIGIRDGDHGYILWHGLLLFGLAALGVVAAMLCQFYAARAAGQFGRALRQETYTHVMGLSGRDTAQFGAGGLITRLTNDINQIQTGLNMAVRLGTRAPFLAVGSIVMALLLDTRIGLIFVVSTPLILLVLYLVMKYTLPSYRKIQSGQDRLSRLSAEGLAGVRVIRAFSRQEQEQQDYDAAADDLTRLTIRAGKISALLNPLTTLIVNIAIGLIVWMGAVYVNQGEMEAGTIVALVSYMNQTLLALIVAANLIVLFTRAIASSRRVGAVLDMQPSVTVQKEAEPDSEDAAVCFRDVTFAYHKQAQPVLENISFSIKKGQTVGLIGSTGSGKSTVVNLIMRFFDTDAGGIYVNGLNVKTLDPRTLRESIGLVPQTAVLFSGTIRENMQMAVQNAEDAEIWQALETAQAGPFVEALPKGLHSPVEEGGKNFSGGQRQRLTIARAVLQKPELLILDDSASALDFRADAALRSALKKEMNSRPDMTVLMITQRAGTIKGADNILVLDDGRLVGAGTHDALLRDNPVYREICQSQGITAEAEQEAGI